MSAITYPRPYMTDGSARPLENGAIYIGVENQDPETHPVQVYWDAALTVPAAQPLEVSDGYVRNTGTRADFYIAETAFSIRLRDKNGTQVDYIASVPTALSDLSGPDGASKVGTATGGTVEDAIFHKGRATPIAGAKAQVNWVRDDPTFPAEDEGSIWTGATVFDHAISATFDGSDGGAGGPCATLFLEANANGTASDVAAIIGTSIARTAGSRVLAANFIARNAGPASNGSTLYVAEFDWTPSAGTTVASDSAAIYINAFNLQCPVGIQFGGVGGGNFAIGIVAYGMDNNGSFLVGGAAETMGCFINTTASVFTEAAIKVGANQRFKLDGTGGASYAQIYNPSNALFIVGDANGVVVRNQADTQNNAIFEDAGSLDLRTSLKVAGTKVVGTRDTGWATQTAAASKANLGASPTVGALASWAAAVDAALKAHGLFGT